MLRPEYGADPALKDREGGTTILRTVNRGAESALIKMIKYPIDIECVDDKGQSLLYSAARNGYYNIARLLMEVNVPDRHSPKVNALGPNLRDIYGYTPLYNASQRGDLAVTAVLLEKGADVSLLNKFGRTPFMVAWLYRHDNIMRMFTAAGHGQLPVLILDDEQLTAWSMARQGRKDLIAETIRTRPQDLHVAEPCTENSALHCAIEAERIEDEQSEILDMLLETGLLPIDKPNHVERTPLHLAALEGDLDATVKLIDHETDMDVKDRWQDEALVLAQSNHHLEITLELIRQGANVDKRKIDINRLFFFAVEQQDAESARILLRQHGVDRSIQNADGVRAIQIAEAAEDTKMMAVLNSAPTVADGGDMGGLEDGKRQKFVPFRSRPIEL